MRTHRLWRRGRHRAARREVRQPPSAIWLGCLRWAVAWTAVCLTMAAVIILSDVAAYL